MKGKFSTPVAEYLHGLTGDGTYPTCGDTDLSGHATLVEFNEVIAAAVNDLIEPDERTGRCCWFPDDVAGPIITGHWGAIVTEDHVGFVEVELLAGSDDAWNRWAEVQHDLEPEEIDLTVQ